MPNNPGVGSAIGFLFAPISFEVVRSHYTLLESLHVESLNQFLANLTKDAENVVRMGAPAASLHYKRTAFMRYRGQGHEIEVSLPNRDLNAADINQLRQGFETEYQRMFSRAVPGMVIEILNWAVNVSTSPESINTNHTSSPAIAAPIPVSHRTILCDVTDTEVTAFVYLRENLLPGHQLKGLALVIEPQTTTFVSRDFELLVQPSSDLLLTRIT